MPLSDNARLNFAAYTPCALGPVSLAGSCLTMLTIFRTWKARSGLRTYHRLLLGISVFDCILSFATSLGPLPIPRDFVMDFGQRGNRATCTFQAFLFQLGSGSLEYSAMLMLYYFLVICFGVREKKMVTWFEPVMHLIPIGYHLGTSFLGLVWEVFNPAGIHCWVAAEPVGCEDYPDIPCDRGGDRVHLFGFWLLVVPMLAWTCLLCIFILTAGFTVWWKYQKSARFRFESSSDGIDSAKQRTHRVLFQCFLYAFSFINWIIWSSIQTVLYLYGVSDGFYDKHFWIKGMTVFFFPIQGLFNFLIYIRPRYLSNRRYFSEKSRWYALKEAVWNPVATTRRPVRPSAARPNRSHPTGSRTMQLPVTADGSAERSPITPETSHRSAEKLVNTQEEEQLCIDPSACPPNNSATVRFDDSTNAL